MAHTFDRDLHIKRGLSTWGRAEESELCIMPVSHERPECCCAQNAILLCSTPNTAVFKGKLLLACNYNCNYNIHQSLLPVQPCFPHGAAVMYGAGSPHFEPSPLGCQQSHRFLFVKLIQHNLHVITDMIGTLRTGARLRLCGIDVLLHLYLYSQTPAPDRRCGLL